MKSLSAIAILVSAALAATHPFATVDMVNKINSAQSTWKASLRTPTAQMTAEHFRSLLGVRRDVVDSSLYPALPRKHFTAEQLAEVPETYDPRDFYSCKSMRQIRDQSKCGSCWAFGAVSAMSDRECMLHGEDIILSAEDVNSCSKGGDCSGGAPIMAWTYWRVAGIVTEKCRPYSLPRCDHYKSNATRPCPQKTFPTPACVKECVNTSGLVWKEDKHKSESIYTLSGEEEMMAELSANGPCESTFVIFEDFLLYTGGVYQHVTGTRQGEHAVKVMGYGVTEDGTKYWLCANSWNEEWGENGFFRILRGSNECGIENDLYCGSPL